MLGNLSSRFNSIDRKSLKTNKLKLNRHDPWTTKIWKNQEKQKLENLG